ncbi:saccharopine dehydrogenase NADP-binding domain-containing protein [Curtobacterium sp. PhB136]|uniref:saccharopine dehydrogenase NADP-binding domain-containing protein n=1 Tax=Curtobacterium sp. PhB136 TaxID=2485181 RepID=UPI001043F7E9|nr:saccharopine dehydrogenase NADP-binding domain-containing protein [Curtobacterium sp. PhB136]TCK64525.1 short subunit dehydrogenase-like uncharacterized protein [Curtobacterium sp. PhB136]
MTTVWILGGTGRTGRAVSEVLTARGLDVVLVGRDAGRLRAATPPGARSMVLTSAEVPAAVRRDRPRVVLNTVGPFAGTADPVVDACLDAGADYVDLANDMAAVPALLARNAEAVAAGRTLVTGAGFGVTGTESVVARLTATRSDAPLRVRVDMVPSLALQAGQVGEALAGTIVEGLPGVPGGGRFQGRLYQGGQLRPTRIGGMVQRLVTPDGDVVTTAAMPLGELVAAQRASGAPDVLAASSEAPSGRLVGLLPLGTSILVFAPVRRLAGRLLARVRFPERPAPRTHSWGHARLTWTDGSVTRGWLALPEAQQATVAIAAEVVRRLADDEGRPGAWTPAALFGPELAESVGGRYVDGVRA